jgi:hypothetical protein
MVNVEAAVLAISESLGVSGICLGLALLACLFQDQFGVVVSATRFHVVDDFAAL